MSGVFQNIDPPPPSSHGECVLPAFGAGGGHTRWAERGVGGAIFWKTPDTALYSTYVSTLCTGQSREKDEWQCQGVQMIIFAFFSLASGGPKGGKV
jgi:hypothetical protein